MKISYVVLQLSHLSRYASRHTGSTHVPAAGSHPDERPQAVTVHEGRALYDVSDYAMSNTPPWLDRTYGNRSHRNIIGLHANSSGRNGWLARELCTNRRGDRAHSRGPWQDGKHVVVTQSRGQSSQLRKTGVDDNCAVSVHISLTWFQTAAM